MTKEELENCIENWFCDAECDSGMFGVAELYAFIYHECKRNLRYWSDNYKREDDDEA